MLNMNLTYMYQRTRLECIKNEIELGDLVKLSKTLDYAICTCMFAEITYQVNKKNFYARTKIITTRKY